MGGGCRGLAILLLLLLRMIIIIHSSKKSAQECFKPLPRHKKYLYSLVQTSSLNHSSLFPERHKLGNIFWWLPPLWSFSHPFPMCYSVFLHASVQTVLLPSFREVKVRRVFFQTNLFQYNLGRSKMYLRKAKTSQLWWGKLEWLFGGLNTAPCHTPSKR